MIRSTFLSILFAAALTACFPEDDVVRVTDLRFSQDTVIFDTLFSTVGSATKRFRVYNDQSQTVQIPEISLGRGTQSEYEIIINGKTDLPISGLEILPGDSALVLVSVNIDPKDQDLPFIVSDSVVFRSGDRTWDVDLVAWGQDAWFLSDSVLACNTVWSPGRPYVIYNSILVDTLCLLTIEPGVEVYSHPGSAIYVKGTVNAVGTGDERILFRNDRLDEDYENAAGQWEGIYFLEGSHSNLLKFVDIKNSVLGIRVGTPDEDDAADLSLENSRIENVAAYGLLAFNSDIFMENVLVNNCQLGAVALAAGGNYTLRHCTLANYPLDFLFGGPVMILSDNVVLPGDDLLEAPLNVSMHNSVVWGLARDEILVSQNGNVAVVLDITDNVLRTELTFPDNLINVDPLFMDPFAYDYGPSEDSPLLDAGSELGVAQDLFGKPRSSPPDLGAIERQ